jgi:hypothetical protein
MVLLVIVSTCLAPFGPEMVPSRVTISDTVTFLMLLFSFLSCWLVGKSNDACFARRLLKKPENAFVS